MRTLEEGIGRYDSIMPKDLPPGLVEPSGRYMTFTVRLSAGDKITAHAGNSGVSVSVSTVLNHGLSIVGSFEQIRFLLATWGEQLDSMEAEARTPEPLEEKPWTMEEILSREG